MGDYVLSYNQDTKTIGFYPVQAVLVHTDKTLTEVIINGERIETTPEHPFYTKEKGWLPAGELRIGMHVREADGKYGLVWFTWSVSQTQQMYNLTVSTAHTFFVGNGQWLVHNTCPIFRKAQVTTDPTHAAVSQSFADDLSQSPSAANVYLNKSISTITGGQVPSLLRPDVAVEYDDGSFGFVEKVSPSQSIISQVQKMDQMAELLSQQGLNLITGQVIP